MKKNLLTIGSLAFLVASLFLACQNNSGETAAEETATEQTQTQPEQAASRGFKEGERLPGISAVDWSELQALVPNTAAGLPRTNAGEDKSNLGDLGFSHALGIYEKEGRRVEVQFLDSGSQKTILSAVAPWFKGNVVEEKGAEGSEMTTTVKGYPGIEHIDRKENTAEVSIVIKDRFVVMVAGTNVPIEELRKVMNGLDLDKLANL